MLRAMTHATARAKRQTRHKLETTCWAGEQGEGKWLALTSISALIHYRLYMSKRLQSVVSVERACDAFVRLLSPQGSATLPSLAANSKHCYLEWCISLCLPAGVDSPSPTQTQTHTYTNRSHVHMPTSVWRHTWMLTQTDTHTHILLPLVSSAGIGADTSQYLGAADPLLCSRTLF